MKKFTLILVLAVMLVFVALPVWAATTGYTEDKATDADTYKGTVSYNSTDENYAASYSGAEVADNGMYLLLVVKGDGSSIGVGDITYIDQTLPADGTVSFNEFIPRYVPESTVLLAGTGIDSPIKLGKLIQQGVSVSGSLQYYKAADSKGATVSLGSAATKNATNGDFTDFSADYSATVAADGSFTINGVAPGNYILQIKYDHHLTYYCNVSIEEEKVLNYKLISCLGDVAGNGDGVINPNDLSQLLLGFGNGNYPQTDLTGDGVVNPNDLSQLLLNYGNNVGKVSDLTTE